MAEEGSFKYVFSGSLLGEELTNLKSAPVGYLQTIKVFPMDFYEFLKALNVRDSLLSNLENCFKTFTPVDQFVHEKIMESFKLYLVVGGMPEAVAKYVETHRLSDISEIHYDIIEQYKKRFH